jgi:hypothetical protein
VRRPDFPHPTNLHHAQFPNFKVKGNFPMNRVSVTTISPASRKLNSSIPEIVL